ncbi:MAG: hypothetical protein IPI64_03010 [Chloracidobacterium sp.]|nr:hypothetical protein [Chloracidobacterium sp.]
MFNVADTIDGDSARAIMRVNSRASFARCSIGKRKLRAGSSLFFQIKTSLIAAALGV